MVFDKSFSLPCICSTLIPGSTFRPGRSTGLLLCLLAGHLALATQAFAATPDAIDDSFNTPSGSAISDLLATNDLNLDGPNDVYSKTTDPANGSATVNSDGTFTYTPNTGFAGTDQFTYNIDDGAGGTDTAQVSITVASSSDFLSAANPIIVTQEDTSTPLGLSVSADLFNGGALQDVISSDIGYRPTNAGATPTVFTIPSGTSSVVITGFSTQSNNTNGADDTDDDYQLLNARIDLIGGLSSGRVAFLNHGKLNLLDQYAWEDVTLGQSVLSDPTKVIGYHAVEASDPTFKIVGSNLQIIETHTLETSYHVEFMTADGDSTNFIQAGNTVQTTGNNSSSVVIPSQLEPASGKKGIIILNSLSAAAGSNSAVEHKGMSRLVIDLDSGFVSGAIAAQQGETSNNTVTYSFSNYPLVDLRVGGSPISVLASSATIIGDTTSKNSVKDNPTLYIDASGALVITRSSTFANTFTSMFTAEFYERTGYSSIASFVAVSTDDAFFDASPADGVDSNGKPIDELLFEVPASAQVGIFQASWNTTGGSDTNENIGMGFAIVDLNAGTTSGAITFIRTSTPDLLAWDGVTFGSTFFGATDGSGNPLYESNKNAGSFTDVFVETSAFSLTNNADGSRTLKFTAFSNGGTQSYRDYQANAQISWLGNEPFQISSGGGGGGAAAPFSGTLSHGSPTASGNWEIDFSDIPLLAYTPAPHESGAYTLGFALSSTGETESIQLNIEPLADAPVISTTDTIGYVNASLAITASVTDSADVDGSESQLTALEFSGVPVDVTLSSPSGTVTDNGSGNWTISTTALPNLVANSTTASTAVITVAGTNTDSDDIDNDTSIEDGNNGNGADEYDELTVQTNFNLVIGDVPTVTSLLTNNAAPTISGTANVGSGVTLTVAVNGITYTDGDGNLVDNGNGTWDLTIPAGDTLAEGTYAVLANLSHSSGNSGADTTTNELIVDLTPPPAPGVTSQTTMDTTPVISGTTTVGTGLTLTVAVNGVTYTAGVGDLVDNGDGTWDLTIPPTNALPEATYNVVATLADAAGNTSTDSSSSELVVDTTAPATPGVTSLTTNDTTPVISGTATVAVGEVLTVTVNGVTYTAGDGNLTDNADGTWDLTIPTALSEATYDVTAVVTDIASNTATDPSSQELVIDLTAPVAPTVTTQTTNTGTPVISGTATVGTGETLTVIVNGITYTAGDGNLVDNADGTWDLTIPATDSLPEATYDVTVTVTDAAGNATSDASVDELVIDLTPPPAPTVTFQLTNNPTPVVSGNATVNTGDVLTVSVNGVTYTAGDGNLTDNGNGTWDLTIPSTDTLAEASYDVVVTVTDSAGNATADSTNPDLVVDTTPPPAPGVTSQTTYNQTPVISGTTTVGTGLTLTVTVNNITYTAGDGNLVDNGDGTWDLTIPSTNTIPEATYDVVATLADAAGNLSSDPGTNELVVDITSPGTPGVTSLTTNDTTPVISGTATVGSGETLTVEVNGITYTAGGGDLVDNGDGTWDLTIPAASTLPEATYDVTATVTDTAGNLSADPSAGELLIDTTAPAAPTVTSLSTNNTTPVISGTATVLVGEVLTVEVNGITYTAGDGNLVDNADGTWDLTIPTADTLTEATYDVTATVTDGASNATSDSSIDELIVDLTPPPAPSVNFQLTNNPTPLISGTATTVTGDTLTVVVNGIGYTAGDGNLTDNNDGTWDLTIPSTDTLADASYDVVVTVTDSVGNATADSTASDLVVDTTPPPAPGVTSQTTNNQTPVISGTTTVGTGLTLTVTVNNITYTAGDGNLVDNGDGTWDLSIPSTNTIPEATYDVVATLADAAGNLSSDPGTNELVVDITSPGTPGVTSLTTNDTTPVISGTATVGSGETLTVEVNGITYTAGGGDLVDNGDGTWDLTIPAANTLPEATYDVTAVVTDTAGNLSTDPSAGELLIDTTAPAAPTVTSLTTNNTTPVISGTAIVLAGEVLTVEVNGIIYTAGDGNLVLNTDGTWDLTIPATDSLGEAQYEVTATVTDGATNNTGDSSATELTIDLTPPIAPAVTYQLTNNPTPVISGTATVSTGDTLSVFVNNITYIAGDGNLVDNMDGTWSLTIPALDTLADAGYDVMVTITDIAGNLATDNTNLDLVVDTTPPPAPGVTSQTTNNQTPVISGTTTVGTGLTLTVTVNNVTYTAGDGNLVDNGDGTWDLTIPSANTIPEATYDVVATLADAAGNLSSDPGTNELVVDITSPGTPGVTSLTTNDTTPVISGTATVGSGETLTVEVNGITYTAGNGDLVDNGDGTWDLTIPAANTIPEATYDVTATVTDTAGNLSTDPSAGELLIDTTAPTAPTVTAQITNTGNPVISGTATVASTESLSVEVNNITYTAGDGNLVDNGNGTWDLTIPLTDTLADNTYNVTATVTDAATNSTSDSSIDELVIDLGVPQAPVVVISEDADNNARIGASESAGPADVNVTLPANAETGDMLTVTDGTTNTVLTLNTAQISAGVISTTFPTPADGRTLSIAATLTDIAGNISPTGTDDATIDLTAPSAPNVTITEDLNNDTFINIAELSGQVDIQISLPADAEAGDALFYDINGIQTNLTLSAVNINVGSYSTQIPSPGDSNNVLVESWVVDMAANSSASNTDTATLDTTAPATPTVQTQISNTGTPTVSGTATMNSGDVLSVAINSATYLAGDGNLIDNGNGTWDLNIPASQTLSDGTYSVSATITDSALNATTDSTSNELIIDLIAPAVPSVTSLITNTGTPVISGNAVVSAGEMLTVTVNGITYTAGDVNLTDNGDGSWDLIIPPGNTLADNSYEVLVTVTDAAGNATSDNTAIELVIDLIAPVVPTVTAQTTNTGTPVISGTATVGTGETLTVIVNGITYTAGGGNLVDNADGTWDLTIPATDLLAEATYDVTVTVTDAAGNATSDTSTDELVVDLTPPAAPAVTFQLTNIPTPVISGNATITAGDVLTVLVNGVTYTAGDGNLVDNGDGSWDLTIPATDTLADASYDVTVTVTDIAGNSATDSTNPDLVVDTTPPPAPGVTSLTTNSQTPVISGTTTVGTGLTLTVTVNNITYTAGDGNLVDNGDGTWDLTIPSANAIPEATYDVVATLTDAAGNLSSDPGTNELVVDITSPGTPGVTSLTTNDTTPVISGAATVGTGETLTVEVNGIVYTAGDGNLVDNSDGTWDLSIPATDLLAEATYDVTATVTDTAGNLSTDPSAGELLVDTTAPTAPTVTTVATNDTTPVISGTSTVLAGEILTVEVNGITYTAADGNLVDNTDGTWDLTIPVADTLTEATYDVTATVTDGAGNATSDSSIDELLIDLTPPPAPAVTFLLINNPTPVISGTATVAAGDSLTVVVNGITYTAGDGNLIDNSDGSWDLIIPATDTLADASYDVVVTVTDGVGNATSDNSNPDLVVDTTPPPAPGVTSLTTNNQTPVISGTTTVGTGLTLTVTVNNITYTAGDGNLVDNGDGTWDLTIPSTDTIPEATYDVLATLTDTAGNLSSDPGTNELVVDITSPGTPGVTSLTTNDTTPVISGTATVGSGETLTVEVNGIVYAAGDGNLVDNSDGTWDLTIPATDLLAEATYDVTASVTDTAGNTSTDPSAGELLVDTTAPAAPTVTSLTTNNTTPVISGTATVLAGEVLTVNVNGITYTDGDGNLLLNTDGTWDLTIPATDTLAKAQYEVTATVTDGATNNTGDSSTTELTIDLTTPVVPTVSAQTTNTLTPVIGGTATVGTGETLTVIINGITYTVGDGNLVDNTNGTWDLTIPASNSLPEATYDVTVTVTDAAGNTTPDASINELIIDLTPPPVPAVTFQLTNNPTPVISGSATLNTGDVLTVTVDSTTYTTADGNLIDNGDGSWDLTIPATDTLADASYDVTVSVIDIAGNAASDTTNPDLVVDTTPPPAPGVTSLTTNNQTPTISGTTTVGTGLTLTVTVNSVTYTEGDGNLVNNGDGTWDLTIPSTNTIPEATYDVLATLTDTAGNLSSDPGTNELVVDITSPGTPGVTSLTTNDTTPVISGTATVGTGETLTVEVNGIVYTAGDGNLVNYSDGTWDLNIPAANTLAEATYNVTASVTDIAGNLSTDPSASELMVDTTAPTAPTVTFLTTNNTTPVISGTATVLAGEVLSVDVNGITYTTGDGNLVLNANGTWDLTIPATDTLAEAQYEVTATVTDGATNNTGDSSTTELTIDITPPIAPTVTYQLTNNSTPVIIGTATTGTGDVLSVMVNNITYIAGDGNLVDNTAGTWNLNIPPSDTLADGGYDVIITITDIAGNTNNDNTNPDLVIDTIAPPAPGVTSLTTNNQTPTISGTNTVGTGLMLTVNVNNVTYTEGDGNLVNNGDGTWDLTIPSANNIPEATYDVLATLTDAAGNASTDSGTSELMVDITSPGTPGVTSLTTNDTTPVISGTATVGSGETLTVEVNGIIYTAGGGDLVDNSDGTWTLSIPAIQVLTEASYNVTASVSDSAGNSATDPSSLELLIDLTAPVIPAATPQIASISAPQVMGTATVNPGEVISVTLNGVTYTAGDGNLQLNANNTWTLNLPANASLPDGVYEIAVTITDLSGNTSDNLPDQTLTIDTQYPTLTAGTSDAYQTYQPNFSGTSNEPDGSQVVITDNSGNVLCTAIVFNNNWSCQSQVNLPSGDNNLLATITDSAGNSTAAQFIATVSDDFDGDGIPNSIEGNRDSDGDGVADDVDLDSDNDGIIDLIEGRTDTDNDGVPNYLDSDSDNDGIPDTLEVTGSDADRDFTVDNFTDQNNDGLSDQVQTDSLTIPDTDYDGIPDHLDTDSDQDGVVDLVETDSPDIDNDGRIDEFSDTNADGVDDGIFAFPTAPPDTDGDGLKDYLDWDSDNDQLSDLVESGANDRDGDNIVDSMKDTDRDAIPDSVDVTFTFGADDDNDGIDDTFDATFLQADAANSGANSSSNDQDGDGIINQFDPDSNGDGYADSIEKEPEFAAALPDLNENGISDIREPAQRFVYTGLQGHGCTLSDQNNRIDLTLAALLCISFMAIRRRRTLQRKP